MNQLWELQFWIAANYKILWGDLVRCSTVDFMKILAGVLLFGIGFKLVFHALYLRRLRSVLPLFTAVQHPRLFKVYHAALSKVGSAVVIPLHRYTGGPFAAFTMGILKPAVFIQPLVVECLDDEELEALLVHELQHIKRRDCLKNCCYELAGALIPIAAVALFGLFFVASLSHSLIAGLATLFALVLFYCLLKHRFTHFREKTCDDLTVNATGKPLALASSLIKVWRFHQAASSAGTRLFAPGQHILNAGLEVRVRRLVNYRRPRGLIALTRLLRLTLWSLVFLTTLFLYRFHVTDSYGGIGLERAQEGCVVSQREATATGVLREHKTLFAIPAERCRPEYRLLCAR